MKVGKIQTIPIARAFNLHKRQVVEDNDRDHLNLLFYLDNWDHDDTRGTYVWEQHEDLNADVFVGETAC